MCRKLKGVCAALCVIFIALPAGLPGEQKSPLAALEENVRTKTLHNGATVIAYNRGYSPTLALTISFKVGSVDESYRTAGAAHMLEHMLFKGTDKIGTKDYAREKKILDQIEKIGDGIDRLKMSNPADRRISPLEKQLKKLQDEAAKYIVSSPYDSIYTSIGAVGFNASTSRDRTSYYIELPASRLETWAELESERLRNPVMREFYQERRTVVEERLMRYDSKGVESLVERFIATAFMAHPYRHPVIGWASNVGFLSLRDVRAFYNEHYIPSLMTITVVGKQNPDNTNAVVEKYFGTLPARNEKNAIIVTEPRSRGERRFEMQFDANPYIIIGWNKPTYPSRDDYICDIVAALLADGKTSRLYRALVLQKQLAASVDAWNGFPGARYDNLFVIAAAPKHPHTAQEVEQAVYEEIARLKVDLTQSEIRKVVNKAESSMVFDLDSNRGLANTLGYYQTVFGDWRYVARYLAEIETVTVQDVYGVLDRYFTKQNRTVGVLVSRPDAKK